MKRSLHWFTERATQAWRTHPGRSLLALVPRGCSDSDAARGIEHWVADQFRPPPPFEGHRVVVVRAVADQRTGSHALLSTIDQQFRSGCPDLETTFEANVGERLTDTVSALHAAGGFPVLIVERFHSFARVADDQFMSLLSCLRTLEHDGELTTIAFSPVGYDVIRRRLAAGLPFVNSAYGDNHDRAVMQPLTYDEFQKEAEAAGLAPNVVSRVHALGGGPDVVYQALIDEAAMGLAGLEQRCLPRCEEYIGRLLEDVVGPWEEHHTLFRRIASGQALETDRAQLEALPQAAFVVRHGARGLEFAGPILLAAVQARLREQPAVHLRTQSERQKLHVAFVAANPDRDLDLEEEIHAVEASLRVGTGRDHARLVPLLSARPEDLIRSLRSVRPNVVHFACHGSETAIVLRGDGGQEQEVRGQDLAVALAGRGVGLVVVNACWSAGYVQALIEAVSAVICTCDVVDDVAAQCFSGMLYQALADGLTVEEAFRDATNLIRLRGFEDVYVLHGNGGMSFVDSRSS